MSVVPQNPHPSLDHRFNDDLLIDTGDQELARRLFPGIYHILDHVELRTVFERYNRMSNEAKNTVHRLGLWSVVLATLALLFSAVTPVTKALHGIPDISPSTKYIASWAEFISVYIEIGGLIGAAIALGGLWIANYKKQWLEGRLMTERLRQWRFQMLLHRGKEIEESCEESDTKAKEKFVEKRNTWFATFLREHEGKLDSVLQELAEAPESCYKFLIDHPSSYPSHSTALPQVMEAYKQLRLKHQVLYAAHKLQKTTTEPFWRPSAWPMTVLKERLALLSSVCLIVALVVSAFTVIAHFADWPIAHGIALSSIILCLLVLNAAARAVQDGLAVREETQRYIDYSGEMRYLLTRFETTGKKEEKLRIMEDAERAIVEELKGFIRSHSEARFIV